MATPANGNERWVRCIVLAKRKEGMSQEEFDRYWRDVHGAIARNYPNVVRYAQLHLTGTSTVGDIDSVEGDGEPLVDGLVDFIYTSKEDVPRIWESPAGKEGVEDSPNFLSSVTECYVEELLVTDHLGLGRLIDHPLKTQPLRYP